MLAGLRDVDPRDRTAAMVPFRRRIRPMASTGTQRAASPTTDPVQSLWTMIRAHLEARKAQLYDEIRNYPRPIPACDQQFNYLLEERVRLSQELEQLDEVCRERLAAGEALKRVEEFLQSSCFLDQDAGQTIWSRFKEV